MTFTASVIHPSHSERVRVDWVALLTKLAPDGSNLQFFCGWVRLASHVLPHRCSLPAKASCRSWQRGFPIECVGDGTADGQHQRGCMGWAAHPKTGISCGRFSLVASRSCASYRSTAFCKF